MKTEIELLIEYAKAWNNQDARYLEPILNNNFRYASQFVFEEMVGKEKYLNYIKGKFLVIRKNIEEKGDKMKAEIAYCTYGFPNKPCIVLTQISGNTKRPATLLIKVEDDLIIRADLGIIPTPESAKLTGQIPK